MPPSVLDLLGFVQPAPVQRAIGFLKDLDYQADPTDPLASLGETLLFQHNPDEVKRGIQVAWAGQVVPGWSHRRLQYGGGGARTFQFKLRWYLDNDKDDWVRRQTLWLESQTVAEYDGNGILVNAPHRLLFGFGGLTNSGLLRNAGKTTVITSLALTYGPLWTPGLEPIQAEADLTLEEFRTRSQDYAPVRIA